MTEISNIDAIVEMIFKEARGRKDESFDLALMMLLFEVTDRICDAIKTVKVEKIKNLSPKVRMKEL